MSSIPVDFPLPYGSETWRAYKMTMKRIGLFQGRVSPNKQWERSETDESE